jgi:lipoprotein-releasing system ATP-binding protein
VTVLAESASPLLQAHQIQKFYCKDGHRLSVLSGVDLTLYPGDMISIVGRSGAGKSTLLHILGSLDHYDSGDLCFEGRSLVQLSDDELSLYRNQSLGFVFQFHHLLPELTACENVMLPALIARHSTGRALEMANTILERVDMKHRAGHYPAELSGGEQQRVALARALILTPKLLLADEVTGNLDPKTAAEIIHLLFDLNQSDKLTIVLVTHNASLAAQMPLGYVLESGKLLSRKA